MDATNVVPLERRHFRSESHLYADLRQLPGIVDRTLSRLIQQQHRCKPRCHSSVVVARGSSRLCAVALPFSGTPVDRFVDPGNSDGPTRRLYNPVLSRLRFLGLIDSLAGIVVIYLTSNLP